MIYIDKRSNIPYYKQVYNQILESILSGDIKPGDILTGSRLLASEIGIGRNTVDNAYAQLAAEGYIEAKKGIGFQVQNIPELKMKSLQNKNISSELNMESSQNKNISSEKKENIQQISYTYDLNYGNFSKAFFPTSLWKKYTVECLAEQNSDPINIYPDKQGDLQLRKTLANYLKQTRGVTCTEEQIVITCGLQSSLDLIYKLLFQKTGMVAMEEPGYHKAVVIFKDYGVPVFPIPVDDQGAVVSALPNDKNVKAVYITPSHQFPIGSIMPIKRRYEFLTWAEKNHAYIIEDDYDSEYSYHTNPVPALQSIDQNNRVIYLGTFSKSLSPSMRMGYMVLPDKLLSLYNEVKEMYHSVVPWINQSIVSKMIEHGDYSRQIRKLRTIFKKRHNTFINELEKMRKPIIPLNTGAGLHFILEFPKGYKTDWLVAKAAEGKIKVYSPLHFWQNKENYPDNLLFAGFSLIEEKDIPHCLEKLDMLWFKD